LFVLLKLRL